METLQIQPDRQAILSDCRTRRFLLSRVWSEGKTLLFIGLNPSVANENQDDHTVKKLVRYSQRWGYGRLIVCNLFTTITPYPASLPAVAPEEDDSILLEQAANADMILVGWGAFEGAHNRACHVLDLLKGFDLYCLGRNDNGSPKHPGRLAANAQPELFQKREGE